MDRATLTNETSIILPLPMQLQDVNETVWQEEELGFAAGSFGQTWYGAQNIASGQRGITDVGVGGAAAAAEAAVAGALNVADVLSGGAASGLAQVIAGYSPNQFLTILFKGPKYKRHELSWKILPKDKEESITINKMIKMLNNAMAPAISRGGFFWEFPNIFQLALYPNSKYLFKFKPCVMETFACNYTPGGVPAFFHQQDNDANAPEAVEFRMRFLELEFWLKGDFNESNDPYDNATGMVPSSGTVPSFNDNGTPNIPPTPPAPGTEPSSP